MVATSQQGAFAGLGRMVARARKFRREETGSATVEAILWIPLLFWLLILIADVSFIFYGRAQTMRIVQDGNRAFSVGRLADETETEDFIRAALATLAPGARVVTRLDNGVISTVVDIPAADLVAVGSIPGLSGFDVNIRAQHLMES